MGSVGGLKKRWWRLRGLLARGLAAELATQLHVVAVFQAWRLRAWLRDLAPARAGRSAGRARPSTRRILVVSYYAWPYRSVYGTQRTGKFIKYLCRMGWDVTLVTTQPGTAGQEDARSEPLPAGVEIVRLPALSPSVATGEAVLVPDDFVGWVLPAARTVRRLVAEKRPAAIYATAPPYSNLLAGALASMHSDVPLISDFRDPWSRIDTFWVIDTPGLSWLNRVLERQVLRASERIIMVDALEFAGDYFVRHPEPAKLSSIPNGFDEEDFAGIARERSNGAGRPFTVSYVGTFYDEATCASVVGLFRDWQGKHPEDLEHVVFEYAGQSSSMLDACGFRPPFLRDHGFLSHRDSIALRMRSDLQIFAQPSHFKAHVTSGKIYEMLRAGVPILALANGEGAAARLIDRAGAGWAIAPGNPGAASALLKDLHDRWRRGELAVPLRHDVIRALSREELARRLAALLEEVAVAR